MIMLTTANMIRFASARERRIPHEEGKMVNSRNVHHHPMSVVHPYMLRRLKDSRKHGNDEAGLAQIQEPPVPERGHGQGRTENSRSN